MSVRLLLKKEKQRKLNKELGVTVIMVTHEKDVADRTKRKIYIHDGQILNT